MPFPTVQPGDDYPRWDKNTEFEKSALRAVGLPEDFHPTEEEAYRIITEFLEGED